MPAIPIHRRRLADVPMVDVNAKHRTVLLHVLHDALPNDETEVDRDRVAYHSTECSDSHWNVCWNE